MGNCSDERRNEWLRVMTSLAKTNPEGFQMLVAEGWDAVRRAYEGMTPAERALWSENAS